jgi:hypothetical protein
MEVQVLFNAARGLALGDASLPWLKIATIAAPALADDGSGADPLFGDEPPSAPQANNDMARGKQRTTVRII